VNIWQDISEPEADRLSNRIFCKHRAIRQHLLTLRSVRRGFRIICVSEHLGVEKQEDLTLQAADFDRAVLIEDWPTRLTKFDGDRSQSR
jgi:hypothetical protein